MRGVIGERGATGTEGLCGDPGLPGLTLGSASSLRGAPGTPGVTGSKGPTIDSKYAQSYAFALHSQTAEYPNCNSVDGVALGDAQEIKKGYSALFMEQSSGAGTGQGLSFGGSCFSEFTVAPIMECTDDACDIRGDDASIWMSIYYDSQGNSRSIADFYPAGEIIAQTRAGEWNPEILKHVSRCVVCETPNPWFAIHSFSQNAAACPNSQAWTQLWSGYSFIMARDGRGGTGQELALPGSCLRHFSPIMSAKCVTSGAVDKPNCHFQSKQARCLFVRAHQTDSADEVTPNGRDTQASYISRCVVCRYDGIQR